MLTVSLEKMLKLPEQEYLDFKKEYSDNNAALIHDLLCLLNAEAKSDRYLIFGVEDKTGKIIGVENDKNRKNSQNIINLIRNAKINKMPTISIETSTIDGHEIDILILHNKKHRPYFLLNDFTTGKKTIRAGVIYTRDGDCNTDTNGTADTAKIQSMWRENFGLDLTPIERLEIYIKEHDMWLKQPSSIDKSVYYYKQFPEFTIELETEDDCKINLDWYSYRPAILYNINLSYFNTVLDTRIFYSLDKEKCFFPFLDSSRYYACDLFPDKEQKLSSARWHFENEFYFALKDDISYEIYNLFRRLYNYRTIEDFASSCFAKAPIHVFNNLKEAKIKIKELGIGKIGAHVDKN